MADRTAAHLTSTNAGQYPAIVLENTVDAATVTTTISANQVDNLFDVYPGDVVLNVSAKVITVDAGVTADVGDGSDVDGYIDAVAVGTAGWYTSVVRAAAHTANATLAAEATTGLISGYGGGKVYTTTDTIDVKWLGATVDTGKVKFRAIIIRA